MVTEFDKKDIFDATIAAKVSDVIQACNKEHLPVFIAVCTKNDEKGTDYDISMYSGAANEIKLKEDFIPMFVNVTNGFSTIPPAGELELDFD